MSAHWFCLVSILAVFSYIYFDLVDAVNNRGSKKPHIIVIVADDLVSYIKIFLPNILDKTAAPARRVGMM